MRTHSSQWSDVSWTAKLTITHRDTPFIPTKGTYITYAQRRSTKSTTLILRTPSYTTDTTFKFTLPEHRTSYLDSTDGHIVLQMFDISLFPKTVSSFRNLKLNSLPFGLTTWYWFKLWIH